VVEVLDSVRLPGGEDVRRALQYVIDEQGEPMALFVAENL
jgi:hypothetical protein